MQAITKKEFKQLHADGKLSLAGAALLTKEDVADVIEAARKNGAPLMTQPTTSYGNIDDRHHKLYRDGDIVYLERIEQGDDWKRWSSHRPKPHTTVYQVK